MDEFGVVCKLCDAAVLNVFEVAGDECVETMRFCGKKDCGEEREKQDACGTERHVRDEVFAEGDGAAFGIDFKLFGVQLLGELTDGF